MFKSIRWRLSILYFVLVFIAMSIVGVIVVDRLEEHNLSIVKENLAMILNRVSVGIVSDSKTELSKEEIKKSMERFSLPIGYNVYIIDVDKYDIVASSNENFIGENAMEVLDSNAMMITINEGSAEVDVQDRANNSSMIKIYTTIYYSDDGNSNYIIYSTASLDSVYNLLKITTRIMLFASSIALFVALIIGYIISASITTPINELNTKASLIAKGDFSQRVTARSNDEIGMLSNTFNYLTKRLDNTLIEISSEKSKLDAIINNMADGIMAIDGYGFVVSYNKALLKLLDSKGIIFYGNNIVSIAKDLDLNLSLSEIKKSLGEQEVGNFTIKTRNEKILRVSVAYFQDDSDKQMGFILLFQDFTKLQKLEDMRKEFVANVSHELKTPITTIKTYAETLGSGDIEDKELAKSFINTIEKEADRMSSLVKDLLQLSHIDFKKTNWDFQNINLTDLIYESIEHLKIYYEEKNQSLNFYHNDDIIVYADRTKLKQVFVNIISNAIKYTQDNGIIEIESFNNLNDAIVTITDNGIGIPKEDVNRVFERFYRVDKARSREQGGTGLGLAIAQDIVEAHSGKITLESEYKKGSTFKISLPLIDIKKA